MSAEKKIDICLTMDFDAIAGWIGPRNTRSPNLVARGEFGEVGAERILQLFADEEIPGTWYIPGHTIDTYPDVCRRIAEAGHEIGYHGYCHEAPSSKRDEAEERDILDRSIDAIVRVSGKSPVGQRLPGGNLGVRWVELLIEKGFIYDSSMAPHDFEPTYLRRGDVAHKDRAYEFGQPIDFVVLPFDWNLDDWPYFTHEPATGRPGLRSPNEVFEIWADEFKYLYEKLGKGVYVLCLHPQCIGKGSRMLMLERLIQHIKQHEGVRFRTMASVAEEFRKTNPLEAGSASA